jgi:hypothetical protein
MVQIYVDKYGENVIGVVKLLKTMTPVVRIKEIMIQIKTIKLLCHFYKNEKNEHVSAIDLPISIKLGVPSAVDHSNH